MEFQRAGVAELPKVLDLMREFYPSEGLHLDEALAAISHTPSRNR